MFRFANPWVLALCMLIIPLVLLFKILVNRRESSFRFSNKDLVEGLNPTLRLRLSRKIIYLRGLIVFFFILAAARPQSAIEETKVNIEGIDIDFSVGKGVDKTISYISLKGTKGILKISYSSRNLIQFLEFVDNDGKQIIYKEYKEKNIGYYEVVRKIFDQMQGLGHIKKEELDFRVSTAILGVEILDNMQRSQ